MGAQESLEKCLSGANCSRSVSELGWGLCAPPTSSGGQQRRQAQQLTWAEEAGPMRSPANARSGRWRSHSRQGAQPRAITAVHRAATEARARVRSPPYPCCWCPVTKRPPTNGRADWVRRHAKHRRDAQSGRRLRTEQAGGVAEFEKCSGMPPRAFVQAQIVIRQSCLKGLKGLLTTQR